LAIQHNSFTADADTAPGTLDWRRQPPTLETRRLVLRELAARDAAALTSVLASPEVWRFIDRPPSTSQAFKRFIAWSRKERRAGRYLSLAVTLRQSGEPIGVLQVWPLDPAFRVAEWGFVFGRPFWGKGLFREAATAVGNTRGLAALRSIGSADEGVLRKCFDCLGEPTDHVISAILAAEWRERRRAQRKLQ
jgi:[ribosomal protein S5]-alanine N-acetyltransferase